MTNALANIEIGELRIELKINKSDSLPEKQV